MRLFTGIKILCQTKVACLAATDKRLPSYPFGFCTLITYILDTEPIQLLRSEPNYLSIDQSLTVWETWKKQRSNHRWNVITGELHPSSQIHLRHLPTITTPHLFVRSSWHICERKMTQVEMASKPGTHLEHETAYEVLTKMRPDWTSWYQDHPQTINPPYPLWS